MKRGNSFLIIPLALAMLFSLTQLYGQAENTYQFVTFSNSEGFNQNTVKSIDQDKTGTIWIGTSNGLIRYNGYSFQNISWESKFQSDVYHGPITSIVSDREGLVWIVTSSGLNLYSPDKEEFIKVTSDSLGLLYRTIEDTNGSMWVVGDNFLSNVSTKTDKDSIITFWSPNLLKGTNSELNITDLLELGEGRYLLATSTGLFKMSVGESLKNLKIEAEVLIKESVSCLKKHNNMIWVGTQSRVV